jgi:rubrerythrin
MYRKMTNGSGLAVVSIALLAINSAFAEERFQPQTRRDLKAAMQDEAFTVLQYRAYAEQARKEGKIDLADFFEERSKVEFRHFSSFANLYGLVGDGLQNIAKAIGDEYVLKADTYVQIAERAEAAGDKRVAEIFRQNAADEAEHVAMFKAALVKTLKPNKP